MKTPTKGKTVRPKDAAKYRLIRHAEERAKEMGVEQSAIYKTLIEPETDYPSHPDYNGPGEVRRVATGNNLAVVYETNRRQVITVLWNRKEGRDKHGQPIKD